MNVKEILKQMTLEEKAAMCSGADYWRIQHYDKYEMPTLMMSDGPYGLRTQKEGGDCLGLLQSIEAVCFPTSATVANSFDPKLMEEYGAALGEEAQAENVGMILGPGVNIKRSPACGRNFEYFSEDPFLAGEMAAAQIRGIQSQGVGACLKHFAVNSQETRRMTGSSEIDERTLEEIYLPAFEKCIKEAKPWAIMASYNKINGTYACQNKKILTDILRDRWGFEGIVVSDWGAVADRIASLKAGLDLDMPSGGDVYAKLIVKCVQDGSLEEKTVDLAVERILSILTKYKETKKEDVTYNMKEHHEKARRFARESLVLLKNERNVLPLKREENIAFIGAFVKEPRYQGSGSAHVNSPNVVCLWDIIEKMPHVNYAKGYEIEDDDIHEDLIKQAVEAAKNTEKAVIFVGLPERYESEGADRVHLHIPHAQEELIRQVAQVQQNTVVILHNGAPVEMPWIDDVAALMDAYLPGEAAGDAIADVLFGDYSPCGKLAESYPIHFEDNPSYLSYIGEEDKVEYTEKIFVGYRYYDKKNMNIQFPFGHGLSYTKFLYSDLELDKNIMDETEILKVSLKVENIGECEAKEIIQLYVQNTNGIMIRPIKELRGFQKINLKPGEKKEICFVLDRKAFAYFDVDEHDWLVESGNYEILAAASSRDIRLKETVEIHSVKLKNKIITLDMMMGDVMQMKPQGKVLKEFVESKILQPLRENDPTGESGMEMVLSNAMGGLPISKLYVLTNGGVTMEQLQKLVEQLNVNL